MIDIDWSFTVKAESDDSVYWKDPENIEWAEQIESSVGELVPLFYDIAKTRKNVIFLKCPAHTDFTKNIFVFKSPIDLDFDIDIDNEIVKVFCPNISQTIFETIVDLRFLHNINTGQSPYPLIGIDFLNIFSCKESMPMTVIPAFLHYNDFTSKTTVLPGCYDIGQWTRPVELVFELLQSKTKISIKQGDALCYFKFDSNQKLNIKKCEVPRKEMEICSSIVANDRFKPLKKRYESRKSINNER